MEIWKLITPDTGAHACDAAGAVHQLMLSERGAEAVLLGGNPLSPAGLALPSSPQAASAVVRTGAIEPETDDPTDAVDAARRTWSGEGRERFDAAWAGLAEQADRLGIGLWAIPQAGDVLGDVPALRQIAAGQTPVDRVLLDPAGLLTPAMLGDAEDHLDRMLEPLEGSSRLGATVVTNLAEIPGGGLSPAAIGDGELDPGMLRAFAARAARSGPVCVLPEDVEELTGARAGGL